MLQFHDLKTFKHFKNDLLLFALKLKLQKVLDSNFKWLAFIPIEFEIDHSIIFPKSSFHSKHDAELFMTNFVSDYEFLRFDPRI